MGIQVKGREAGAASGVEALADKSIMAGKSSKTARELICARAAQEFEQRFLPGRNAADKILRIERPQFANLNFVTQCALEGFKSKAFSLKVDGLVADDLDQLFQVGSVTQIEFIANARLVAG